MFGLRVMHPVLSIAFPLLVAAGSAILAYYLAHSAMQSRMEIALAKEREAHAATQSKLKSVEESIPDKVHLAQEVAQRKAFDQFLMDFRVEERRYLRETKNPFARRRALVTQERLYFRNIPLSNWVEHETALDDGVTLAKLDQTTSVFTAGTLPDYTPELHTPKYLTQ
jgi:hypothetical protein